MTKPENRYNLPVIAREYLTRWAEAQPLNRRTLMKASHFFYEKVICQFGTPELVAMDSDVEKNK